MDSDELQKLAVVAILRRRIRSKRRYWVHPLNLLRPSLGEHLKLELMYSKYPKLFFDYTRLLPNQFDYMFGLMEAHLTKQDTNYRDAVAPRIALLVALR